MIPIRTPLLSDECVESWIESLADLNVTAPGALIPLSGMRNKARTAPLTHNQIDSVITYLAATTGTSEHDLRQATLYRYRETGLISAINGKPTSGTWSTFHSSRYCPQCLDERNLRWKLEWSLAPITICTMHSVVLVDYCPYCHTRPRSNRVFHPREPGHIAESTRVEACSHGCNSRSLSMAEPLSIPADSSLIATDQVLRSLFAAPKHSLAYSDGNVLETPDILCDLHHVYRAALAAIANQTVTKNDLDKLGVDPALVLNGYPEQTPGCASNAWSKFAPALATGLAMTMAVAVLTDEVVPQWFTRESTKSLVVKKSKQSKNPPSRYIDHLVGRIRMPYPSTEKTDTRGRRRRQHSVLALRYVRTRAIDSANLPAALWHTASVHTPEIPPRIQRTFPILTPIALAAIGRNVELAPLAKEFGIEEKEKTLQRLLHQLVSNENGQELWHYILDLHDHIQLNPPPIDYRRRRRLFPRPEPLGPVYERRLSRAGNAVLTAAFRWKIRRYVWQLLTGFDPLATAHSSVMHGPAAYDYKKFVRTMHPDLQDTAGEIAERKLLKHRIGEPVAIDLSRDLDRGQWRSTYSTRHYLASVNRNDLRRSSLSLQRAASTAGDPEELLHIALMGELTVALKLYRFTVTAECKTAGEAGQKLRITTDMFHKTVRDLENAIGNSLFIPASRFTTRSLTPTGTTLLAITRPALPDLRRIVGPKRIENDH